MRWLLLILALAVGAVGGALGAFYLVEKSKAADIVLAPKRFVDTETYVVVSGHDDRRQRWKSEQ